VLVWDKFEDAVSAGQQCEVAKAPGFDENEGELMLLSYPRMLSRSSCLGLSAALSHGGAKLHVLVTRDTIVVDSIEAIDLK
jgi:hypothetical protein